MSHQTVAFLLSLVFVVALQASTVDMIARKAFIKEWLASVEKAPTTATFKAQMTKNVQIVAKKYVNGVQLYAGECLNKQKNSSRSFHLYNVVSGTLEYTERDPCTNEVNFAQTISNDFEANQISMIAGVVFFPIRETQSNKHGGDLCALSDTILYSTDVINMMSLSNELFSEN